MRDGSSAKDLKGTGAGSNGADGRPASACGGAAVA